MPIRKKWSGLDKVDQAPEKPGVYELGDQNGNVVYIGQSSNLQERLQDHVSPKPPKHVKQVRSQQVKNPVTQERQMLREFQRKTGDLPKLNKQSP